MMMIIVVVVSTVLGMILSATAGYYICQLRKAKLKAQEENSFYKDSKEESQDNELELPLFDLGTIFAATNKFSSGNKIGQGGFGSVYKGELPDGQEIAVKRLSQGSGQGLKEFKNEVNLIAKLQHRNLVRLLGCCIQGEERMLIYEFLHNKSLDNFIFDQTRRKLLSWEKRFNIIVGIARGLLYLHEDSRLRIIHRDLKASNILLDNEMCPKISDFGIARIFGGEQTGEMTKRVMGTYGYLSPEYVMSGHFSVKSDVFSFGVLVLEIISGKKKRKKQRVLKEKTEHKVWKKKRMQRVLKEKTEHKGPHERSQDILTSEGLIVNKRDYSGESTTDELELPLFDFGTITVATDNFCDENKLGQGGFGIVYKGLLVEGQEIAVKRLSKNSGQGVEEFKNEVRLIARLQHRNLVRLLGCCVEMEEKMLIYEYMENKSLDFILFNKEKRSLLGWRRRFNIICGIARGLLYLHQDSRFRIIHRDLKASNVLLDREMNPKISDFGMARIFGGDQTEANTMRVVGTYGYMAPEYAMDGIFSVKSDVFSFGVLVLEIVTGKKNRGFYHANQEHNLLGHAWRLWGVGKGLELVDPSVGDSYPPNEVMRCIQVGLLCVQERAEDRPTMSTVVLMLSSENALLPQPTHPGFCLGRHLVETDSSTSKQDESCTVNRVTVTMLDAR